MLRIGIDVGGTHTDAVLVDDEHLLAATKTLTTSDVIGGVVAAIDRLAADRSFEPNEVDAVMLGTTQFTNAVVERRHLDPVAAIRIASPSGGGLPPAVDWPADLAAALGDRHWQIRGGTLHDGWSLAPLDDAEIDQMIDEIVRAGLEAVAITAAFAPMNPEPELEVARRIRERLPEIRVTMSHELGRLGILERENATLLNASLLSFAGRVVDSFEAAMIERGIDGRFFISQNDGTLMASSFARSFPALTFASGPTNSLRGAGILSGLDNAIVVDIGGTTSDIGVLRDGFPRESMSITDVGGVRTNFRMPDLLTLGLGGGSIVGEDGAVIGPQSVGHRLVEDGMVFGGSVLTASDVVVAAGVAAFGDPTRVADLPAETVERARRTMATMIDEAVERMKTEAGPMPVVLVGGGAILIDGALSSASQVVRPEHAGVANALGAARSQVGSEVERLVAYDVVPRTEALETIRAEAISAAVAAGAEPETVRVVDIEEITMSYTTDKTTQVRVKVVGDIAAGGAVSRRIAS